MSVAAAANATTDYINPVIASTRNVFEMMLNCVPRRTGLMLRGESTPHFAVSAMIGFTGRAAGTLMVSFSKEVAFEVLRRMVGTEATTVNAEVADAIGELTNMIAGGAKAQLAHLDLSISIPNIVIGSDHSVIYPSQITPICLLFESEIGPFLIEFAFTNLG